MVEPEKPQMTIWRRVECWISKATRAKAYASALALHSYSPPHAHKHARTHTQKYTILVAFLLQQWFRERASLLRYTNIACLVTLWRRALVEFWKESRTWSPLSASITYISLGLSGMSIVPRWIKYGQILELSWCSEWISLMAWNADSGQWISKSCCNTVGVLYRGSCV